MGDPAAKSDSFHEFHCPACGKGTGLVYCFYCRECHGKAAPTEKILVVDAPDPATHGLYVRPESAPLVWSDLEPGWETAKKLLFKIVMDDDQEAFVALANTLRAVKKRGTHTPPPAPEGTTSCTNCDGNGAVPVPDGEGNGVWLPSVGVWLPDSLRICRDCGGSGLVAT